MGGDDHDFCHSLVLQSPLSEYVHGNGHDDEIRLADVSRCRELDLVRWVRLGVLMGVWVFGINVKFIQLIRTFLIDERLKIEVVFTSDPFTSGRD